MASPVRLSVVAWLENWIAPRMKIVSGIAFFLVTAYWQH